MSITNTARPAVPAAISRSLAICFNPSEGRKGESWVSELLSRTAVSDRRSRSKRRSSRIGVKVTVTRHRKAAGRPRRRCYRMQQRISGSSSTERRAIMVSPKPHGVAQPAMPGGSGQIGARLTVRIQGYALTRSGTRPLHFIPIEAEVEVAELAGHDDRRPTQPSRRGLSGTKPFENVGQPRSRAATAICQRPRPVSSDAFGTEQAPNQVLGRKSIVQQLVIGDRGRERSWPRATPRRHLRPRCCPRYRPRSQRAPGSALKPASPPVRLLAGEA